MNRRSSIQKRTRINEAIRAKEVRVIGSDAEQIGVLPIEEAIEKAKSLELDLVEVAPNSAPPVCRIMDFSKFKYDQEKKERLVKKKQKITQLKQIRIKPRIEEHDFQIKIKQASGFLAKRDKVRVNLMFRGREMAFKEQGKQILQRFVEELSEIAQVEKDPSMEGRVMSVVLSPKSDKN